MYILQKYKIIQSLGKGQFDKVFLTSSQNKKFAIKQLSKRLVADHNQYQQYMYQQIDCMNNIHSPYILKILEKQEDDLNHYFICQYCERGNLVKYQQNLENSVFPVELALKAISHMIMGLLELHEYQYLYKDIKPQNIMIDKNENDEEIFKLADFGFQRNSHSKLKKTINSINCMAPERFQQDLNDGYQIGFGVDIWSMGVTLYYMLNQDYPFQLTNDFKKNIFIIQNACTPFFNYKNAVLKSKKKLINKVNEQLIDLFQQIFKFDADERISFHEIKKHTLLQKYFTSQQIFERSCIVYNKNFESKIKSRLGKDKSFAKFKKGVDTIIEQQGNESQIMKSINRSKKNNPKVSNIINKKQQLLDKQQPKQELIYKKSPERMYSTISSKILSYKFEKQLQQYCFQKERNQLLLSISEFFLGDIANFSIELKLALRYFTLKLYIVYTRNLKQQYEQKIIPKGTSKLNWKEFFLSQEYRNLVQQMKDQLHLQQIKFIKVCNECSIRMESIQSQLKSFRSGFSINIIETNFEGQFKLAFRKTTSYSYGLLNHFLKNNKLTKEQSVVLFFAMINIFICHCINRMFNKNDIPSTFSHYYKWKKNHEPSSNAQFDFTSFKKWLTVQDRDNLQQTTATIIKKYFGEDLPV